MSNPFQNFSRILRENRNATLVVLSLGLILTQIGVFYGRNHRAKVTAPETETRRRFDPVAEYELKQLEALWSKADVADFSTPAVMSNPDAIRASLNRLALVEPGIQESEKRLQSLTGDGQVLFKKIHAYYRNSARSLTEIGEFLLSHQGKYSVEGNHVSFDEENDAQRLRDLVEKFQKLDQDKAQIDLHIAEHNEKIETQGSFK